MDYNNLLIRFSCCIRWFLLNGIYGRYSGNNDIYKPPADCSVQAKRTSSLMNNIAVKQRNALLDEYFSSHNRVTFRKILNGPGGNTISQTLVKARISQTKW
jgi:hypothetical protein